MKLAVAYLLKDSVKEKVVAELKDSARDSTTKVDDALVEGLERAWDDVWEAVVLGLRR